MTAFKPHLDGTKVKRCFSLSDFDFHLPPELIAQHPAPERSSSQLLDGSGTTPVDRVFRDLPKQMQAGDLLVFNDTQVVKARIFGEKSSGGKVELLIERVLPGYRVVAHMKVSKKPPVGATLHMGKDAKTVANQSEEGFEATLIGRWPAEKGALFCFEFNAEPHALMAQYGHMPTLNGHTMAVPLRPRLLKTKRVIKRSLRASLVLSPHPLQHFILTMFC